MSRNDAVLKNYWRKEEHNKYSAPVTIGWAIIARISASRRMQMMQKVGSEL